MGVHAHPCRRGHTPLTSLRFAARPIRLTKGAGSAWRRTSPWAPPEGVGKSSILVLVDTRPVSWYGVGRAMLMRAFS